MRLRYTAAPWAAPELTPEAAELADILADDVWSESSVEFYAERDAKIRLGKRAPKGMQKTLNAVIDRKLTEKLKGVVKLNVKEVTLDEFNKLDA